MKRIFTYALLLAVAGAFTVSFTSCSEDNDNSAERRKVQNEELQSLTARYVNEVVFPTYTNLANEADNLYKKIAELKTKVKAGTTVTQSEIDAICTNYKVARSHWEESEAWLYGAASDFDIDPNIDTWPLVVPTLASDLQNNTKMAKLDNQSDLGYIAVITDMAEENRGFHGIEFIFFRDGKNRNVTFFNDGSKETFKEKDGSQPFAGKNVTAKEELIFATAAAAYLRDRVYQLEVAWRGDNATPAHKTRLDACKAVYPDIFKVTVGNSNLSYGANMLAANTGTSTYQTWRKAVEAILVAGCSNICSEVANQKMGQAYRSAIGKPETHKDENGNDVVDDPNYIESPYSYNSFTDFYGNIMSIQNALYGNLNKDKYESNSIMAYLQKYNSEMANNLQNKLTAALDALKACQNSGTSFVKDPGATYVKTAMDKIGDLDKALNESANWILAN